ncbi:alcohol dehydrogenase [Mesorhizobium australicum]|uniref:alcohol dehydrogenase n=1 Tax=Mesorhizobium australicum TaxID=536018 RepID=A0A1X7N0S3_9HYPH|nr:alcohol dehydrogenase [Mesorhizobium australicum]SMH30875.1 alcohol dehydrogenase [Mesorhizobium australicum]
MRLWAVVKNGQPLECLEVATPEPKGTEVVLEVTYCGVCHSDLHFWKGTYDLGGGKVMTLTDRGVQLPRAPGHEPAGRVVAVGPDAKGVAIGDRCVIFPWMGCGECWRCKSGDENLCDKPAAIGVIRHGGFGSHIVAPHPRYLFDYGNVDPASAATYACSGITVYSAINKFRPLHKDRPMLLIGAGGLGLAAMAMLRALDHTGDIIVVDIAEDKRQAALDEGAVAAIDGRAPDAVAQVQAAAGGALLQAMDFVNNGATVTMAMEALGRGGQLVLVGVAGGEIPLSVSSLIFRPRAIIGSATGSLNDLKAVLDLAKSGKLKPTPVERMPKDKANEAMEKLHSGHVKGRLVLEGA